MLFGALYYGLYSYTEATKDYYICFLDYQSRWHFLNYANSKCVFTLSYEEFGKFHVIETKTVGSYCQVSMVSASSLPLSAFPKKNNV